MQNSVLIEKTENKSAKPEVDNYLRFYVPVRINNNVFTIRIVAENNEKQDLFNVLNADVYDVIIDKKMTSSSTFTDKSGNLMKTSSNNSINDNAENFNPDKLTIEEMLKGVKDADGKAYFQHVILSRGKYIETNTNYEKSNVKNSNLESITDTSF